MLNAEVPTKSGRNDPELPQNKELIMSNGRFNHDAAAEVAREHARLLHIRRLRISLMNLFRDDLPADDVRLKISELAMRESALWHFSDEPYAPDSLLKVFHEQDRALLVEAGRPQESGPTFAVCAAG
jgi:hypothetical protein